jgi:hypothetical protein
MRIGLSGAAKVEGYGAAPLTDPTPRLRRQRGVASIALALMLLIMVSVAAVTLSRMAGSSVSESIDTSLSVAALATADSALERAAYRLGTTTCAGLTPDGVQTVGAAGSTQASYQITTSTGINGGCQVTVQSYVGNASNPRVLRQTQGDIAGGVVVPQDFPNPSPAWAVVPTCSAAPCTSGVSNLLGNASGGGTQAMVAQTQAGVPIDQDLQVNADFLLSAPFTASSGVPIPISFYWRKNSATLGALQTISVQLVDTINAVHTVWTEPNIANTGWTYVSNNMPVPPSANGRTINRIRLRFDLDEGATGSRVGAAFDRVQVGGLIAWRELSN